MLLTHFIWQTVLKPLSGTNAKNGAITPSLTPTMQARCYSAGKWVRATWRGITNLSKHVGALLVLYLWILWMVLFVLVLVLGILWMSLLVQLMSLFRPTFLLVQREGVEGGY